MNKTINTTLDLRDDSPSKVPDYDSATLKEYHKILWSKQLPNGEYFNLSDTEEYDYLCFKTDTRKIRLSSDWIINTYSHWNKPFDLVDVIKKIEQEDIVNFNYIANTIGSFIIFPLNPLGTPRNIYTINQERGTNLKIKDRFDLTLECIRRYYEDKEKENSPLHNKIKEQEDYFNLFVDFIGFCDFFLLQDLTLDNYKKIKYFIPFDDFTPYSYPKTPDEYIKYKNNAIEFIKNRNKRIDDLEI